MREGIMTIAIIKNNNLIYQSVSPVIISSLKSTCLFIGDIFQPPQSNPSHFPNSRLFQSLPTPSLENPS